MRFKLDENFGTRTQHTFEEAGHDVHTVRQESLQGATDEQLFNICQTEQRCLVTLDLDFANVLRFPPDQTSGIAVIRMPRNPTLSALEQLVRQLLQEVDRMSIEEKLWIVEMGRIRVHQSDLDPNDV